jgi:hypothetical protein
MATSGSGKSKLKESNSRESSSKASESILYFGTKYSGFENVTYSSLPKVREQFTSTFNPRFSNVPVFNLAVSGFSLSKGKSQETRHFISPRRNFEDLVRNAKSQSLLLYDDKIRKLWVVPVLSIALQIAHIWAARQSDREMLLSKLPYAKPSADSSSSAFIAIMESMGLLLRQDEEQRLVFADLINVILKSLDTLRKISSDSIQHGLRKQLIGWELMDVAIQKDFTMRREARVDKETWKQFQLWENSQVRGLVLVSRNLEPPPVPQGFITRLNDDHFEVKTRNVGDTEDLSRIRSTNDP